MPKRNRRSRPCTDLLDARLILAGWLLCGAAAYVHAADSVGGAGDFGACIAALADEARRAGISERVVEDVLGNVQRVERVIELDRDQPEFTRTFAQYYTARVTAERVRRGRALLAEHRDLLIGIQRETGVPAHYLVAFWGLETNFGSYFGNVPVPDALATLACDPRRSSFFTGELLSALKIIDSGDVRPEAMVGSWAGAMGHVQFLPSVFLAHAVDADGDGRRDLWGSIPDAMASAARYLAASGWQPGLRWGRQVSLPDGFDFTLAGRDHRQPLAEWSALGLRDAYGNAIPRLDLPASLLVPAGHDGPAYLVYENFDVILRWNRSEYYAISVGRLADRLAGGDALEDEIDPSEPGVSRADVSALQAGLAKLGYDAGTPDGIIGPATRRALSRFQADRNRIADGHVDAASVAAVAEALDESMRDIHP